MDAICLVARIAQLVYGKSVIESTIRKGPMPETIPLRTCLRVELQLVILHMDS